MNKEILRNSRILAIDDQPQNLVLLDRMLRQGGYEQIRTLTDAREALRVFTEFEPDLVALDLRMPNMDGFAFLRQVRSRIPEDSYVPILVLTADSSSKAKREALTLGANDFLTKPLDLSEVMLRVYNLLETRSLHLRVQRHGQELEERVRERTRDLEEAHWELLERLARASELRDDATAHHTQRVGTLAAMLAREIGLPEEHVALIRWAAPLHDVGKIGIRDGLLLKPGGLTPEEREEVKAHTEMGAALLSGSRFPILQMAEQIARYHHENWDGSGYLGLSGEDIPVEARLVAVADVFDVITHRRPYKEAQSVEHALAAIREQGGRQFDPRLTEALVAMLRASDLSRLAEVLENRSRPGRDLYPLLGEPGARILAGN